MEDQEEYLTIDEVALLLSRSVPTVWRLIRAHELQTFRKPLDRRTYVRKGDVERALTGFTPRKRVNTAAATS